MLQNAYFLAKIGADTAENERKFAKNWPKIGNYPTGPGRGRAEGAVTQPPVQRSATSGDLSQASGEAGLGSPTRDG